MERDVNLRLIYIILVLLLALVGTSVFYQMRYNSLKSDYESSFNYMNETIKNLTLNQEDLYSNISDLNVSTNRENALASRLDMKNRELENISTELASVQQKLFECQNNYDVLSANSTFMNQLLAKHAGAIGSMQDLINTLKTDVLNNASNSNILHDIENLQTQLNTLNTN
ncbi:Uncharacterised protein [uncultured archaeon]|nr:Uncharacterised protein [uncultured archaeon]